MTDEQIIKALECCNAYDCETCSALKYCDYMHPGALARASLALINRQKAEIERLTDLSNQLGNDIDIKLNYIYDLEEKIETAKSEAIKEFADRLKEKKYKSCEWSHGEHPYIVEECDIDNLVKEMTEADK